MNKLEKQKIDLKDWNTDRHVIASIQRNMLFIVVVFLSICLLISLGMLKNVYQKKKIEPYILEFNKQTGKVDVVQSQSHKTYTSNRIIRESLIVDYIKTREGVGSSDAEDFINKVRIMSEIGVFREYKQNIQEDINKMKSFGINPRYKIAIKTITFNSQYNATVKFSRQLISDTAIDGEKIYIATIVFNFVDLKNLTLEEMYINPNQFQVSFYKTKEEIVVEKIIPEKDND